MSGGSPFLVPPGDGGLPRRSGKTTRSRSGCIICRARKVKCDERPGTCLNCDRLSISCSGYGSQTGSRRLQSPGHTQAPNGLTKAGTARRRIHSSCGACRSSKTRCSGEKPRCLRCIRKDLDCLYKSVPAPAWIRNTLPPPSSPTEAPISLDQCTDNAATDQTALLPPSNPSNLELPSRFPYDAQTPTPEPRSMSAEMESQTGDSFSWLLLPTLPENEKIFELVEEYFTNIHHLRCLAFIHKPSFIQKLEEELPLKRGCSSLLYIICALGAKFYCLRRPGVTRGSSPEQIFLAGNEWAEEAKRLCYSELNTISMENLMASVLLHDHEIRIGNYSSAFTLSGACVRMAQALQLNLEYSADILCTKSISSPSPCSREARRRLMWSIYVMDSWVGSGVDQLTLLNDFDLKIQLPCHERNFNLQIPGITETLEEGNVLPFIPQHQRPPQPKDNMGLMAYFARLVCIRKKVLRHVKHLAESQMPWLPESEFGTLVASLKQWRDTLPDNMDFSTATIYTRKESSQLGGLCLVHCTYQHTLVDLYRIGLPKLFKIRAPVYFPHEQQDFLQHLQYCCFIHAREIATIIKLTAAHGTRMLADTWIVVVAHESLKVMLYYLTNVVDSTKYDKQAILDEIMPLLQSNVRILKLIAPMFATAKRCNR
ncbi:fungal-specific transcription factor domain-containing protein [Leptodontidium sp. 2 PMI_412]|nr:fungal-specific transcription factor domain-containing protein [Leptodontidium sp. 2 PMI_412]